jgi:hypothetical protein
LLISERGACGRAFEMAKRLVQVGRHSQVIGDLPQLRWRTDEVDGVWARTSISYCGPRPTARISSPSSRQPKEKIGEPYGENDDYRNQDAKEWQ